MTPSSLWPDESYLPYPVTRYAVAEPATDSRARPAATTGHTATDAQTTMPPAPLPGHPNQRGAGQRASTPRFGVRPGVLICPLGDPSWFIAVRKAYVRSRRIWMHQNTAQSSPTSPNQSPTTSPAPNPNQSATPSPNQSPALGLGPSTAPSPTTSPAPSPTTSPVPRPTTSPVPRPTTSPTPQSPREPSHVLGFWSCSVRAAGPPQNRR